MQIASPSPAGATPAMAQWFDAKAAHPDALLFFRMGDFYELFFGDAEAAASGSQWPSRWTRPPPPASPAANRPARRSIAPWFALSPPAR
jgi:hypothetical protein